MIAKELHWTRQPQQRRPGGCADLLKPLMMPCFVRPRRGSRRLDKKGPLRQGGLGILCSFLMSGDAFFGLFEYSIPVLCADRRYANFPQCTDFRWQGCCSLVPSALSLSTDVFLSLFPAICTTVPSFFKKTCAASKHISSGDCAHSRQEYSHLEHPGV